MAGVEPDDLIGIEVTATVYTQESGIYTNKKLRNIHIRRGSSMTAGSPTHSGSESPWLEAKVSEELNGKVRTGLSR